MKRTKLLLALLIVGLVMVSGCNKQREITLEKDTTTTIDTLKLQRIANLQAVENLCKDVAISDWNISKDDINKCEFAYDGFYSSRYYVNGFRLADRITDLSRYSKCKCSYRKLLYDEIRRDRSYMPEVISMVDIKFKLDDFTVFKMLYNGFPKEEIDRIKNE